MSCFSWSLTLFPYANLLRPPCDVSLPLLNIVFMGRKSQYPFASSISTASSTPARNSIKTGITITENRISRFWRWRRTPIAFRRNAIAQGGLSVALFDSRRQPLKSLQRRPQIIRTSPLLHPLSRKRIIRHLALDCRESSRHFWLPTSNGRNFVDFQPFQLG